MSVLSVAPISYEISITKKELPLNIFQGNFPIAIKREVSIRIYKLAKKYKYIRLLADEGNCIVQILKIYQKENGTDDFTEQVMELAAEVGGHFPDYLKSPEDYYEQLTNMEKKVLSLMAQGLGNDEIADRLGKKTGTVKFHSNNIFRKLEVQNRHQAVSRGREIGLL